MSENLVDPLWWILIDKEQFGPYSFLQLEKDSRLTPKTLVWKQGMETWKPAGEVPELKSIFRDTKTLDGEEPKDLPTEPEDDELVIEADNRPPKNWVPLVLIAILLLFLMFRLS